MTQQSWRRIAGSDTNRGTGIAVLAVDFGVSRPEAGFDKLVRHLGADFAVHEPDLRSRTITDSRSVASWLDSPPVPPENVSAVLAYCNGSSLGCALADAIGARRANPPRVLLFDPAVVHRKTLYQDFVRALRPFRDVLSHDLLDAGCRDAVLAARRTGGDLTALAVDLCHRYDRLVRAAMTELDLDAAYGAELSRRFHAYLAYLVDASRHALTTSHRTPVVYLSRDHRPATPPSWPTSRFDATRAALLDDATVGQAVTALLTGP